MFVAHESTLAKSPRSVKYIITFAKGGDEGAAERGFVRHASRVHLRTESLLLNTSHLAVRMDLEAVVAPVHTVTS